jgi:hypothetical protein
VARPEDDPKNAGRSVGSHENPTDSDFDVGSRRSLPLAFRRVGLAPSPAALDDADAKAWGRIGHEGGQVRPLLLAVE